MQELNKWIVILFTLTEDLYSFGTRIEQLKEEDAHETKEVKKLLSKIQNFVMLSSYNTKIYVLCHNVLAIYVYIISYVYIIIITYYIGDRCIVLLIRP